MSIAETSKGWERRVVEGKFPLQHWLGASDHSAVFLTQRGSGQEFQRAAIKLVDAAGGDLERRLSQWRAAAQLSHPHLIQIFQNGPCIIEGSALLYVVSEFGDENLAQILPQRALAPAEVGEMLPPLLDALSYLHKRGLVHGRIRPSNLLAVGDQLKLSSDHVSKGTESFPSKPARDVYDPPETTNGTVSAAGDIWSLGVTLLAALTQKTSVARDTRGDPVVPAAVPEPFRGIIRECLHLEPKRRCSTSDILARLQPAARSVPAEPPPVQKAKPKPLNRGAIALAVVTVVLLIGLIALFSKGTKDKAERPPASAVEVRQPAPQPRKPSPSPNPPKPETPPSSAVTAPQPVPRPVKPLPTPDAPKPDSPGVAVHQVLPDVAKSARNTITGKVRVVVRVDVDSAGKVTDAKLTSPGPSRYFANLALRAAHEWEFTPPTANGEPIASAWAIRFRFGRARTEAAPERLKR